MTMPRYDAPVPMLTEEPASSHAVRGLVHRILVVDDDPAVHRLVSALFTPEGHVVEAVRSGEQGLRMLRERHFDVIIADAMARAGATELFAHALAADRPETCERLILGWGGGGEPIEPRPNGGVRNVRKPFNLRDLHAMASEILANTPPPSRTATAER
jgi:DNA-binding response OmpR family regulator